MKTKTLDYLQAFIQWRLERTPSTDPDAADYAFEFICLTHPHSDHLHGMMPVLEHFCGDTAPRAMRPRQFWDCGFRYNTTGYLNVLTFIDQHPEAQFLRVASGTEFHYDRTEVLALAPSLDMRNRYDTYGVSVNDGSIVLRITLGLGVAILAGDAEFDSWGKVCEEFPRVKHITYPAGPDGSPDKADPNRPGIALLSQENQLKCKLLKVAHHGSKRGTSYEYIEKLSPEHLAIACDSDAEYQAAWRSKFPHAITRLILGEETGVFDEAGVLIPDLGALAEQVATTPQLGTINSRPMGTTGRRLMGTTFS